MGISWNSVTVAGNLTREPELKYTASQQAVCNITIAVNERVKQGQDWVEVPIFVDVTLWQKNAEIACEFLHKGSPVLIGGRLRQEKWEKDGIKHSKLSVTCDRMQLVGQGKRDEYNQGPAPEHVNQDQPRQHGEDFEW